MCLGAIRRGWVGSGFRTAEDHDSVRFIGGLKSLRDDNAPNTCVIAHSVYISPDGC